LHSFPVITQTPLMKITHMLTLLLSFTALFVVRVSAAAQSWQWGASDSYISASMTGVQQAAGFFIATDSAGYSYCVGEYTTDSIKFGTYMLRNTTNSMFGPWGDNGFMVKYDTYGNVVWAIDLDQLTPTSISVDKAGQIYISGYFQATRINIGGYTFTNTAGINYESMYARFDTGGHLTLAGSLPDCPQAPFIVRPDAHGNFYVAASFMASSGFGVAVYNTDLSGYTSDIIIARFNSAGILQWQKVRGATGNGIANDMAVNPDGSMYLTGTDSSALSPGPFTYSFEGRGAGRFFVSRYDTLGNIIWSDTSVGSGLNTVSAIAADAAGNAYVTGSFDSAYISFGAFTLYNATPLNNKMFLVRYNASGSVAWATAADSSRTEGSGVHVSDSQQVWVCGGYYPGVSFGAVVLPSVAPSSPGYPFFLVRYDTAGAPHYGLSLPTCGIGNSSVSTDAHGNVYMTGVDELASISVGGTIVTNPVTANFFIAKAAGISLGTPALPDQFENVFLFPNPATHSVTVTTVNRIHDAYISIYDLTGRLQCVYQLTPPATQIPIEALPTGTYLCRISIAGRQLTKKLVVLH
jgi:hypothetical protein